MDLLGMICAEIQGRLPLYVAFLNRGRDCSFPPEDEKRVEDHIAVCVMCKMALCGVFLTEDGWEKRWNDWHKEAA